MKNLISLFVLISFMALITACGEDEPALDSGATISGVVASASVDNLGTFGPLAITVEAADGLAALAITKDGIAYDAETFSGQTTAVYEFSYTAIEADEDENITFTFTVTDVDGDAETGILVLSVGAAIPNEIKTGLITSNETWTADRIYELSGRVIVDAGATLTIEAGTIIKGKEGDGSLASALIIARGAKLMANGTAENPIIFTSILDDIEVGEKMGSNLTKNDNQKWGGVIILGNAPISAESGDNEASIEGLPGDETFGLYGGSIADDNSGTITYVSIRHGGALIGEGNEINGLTLGGVGNGTVINHVEVFATLDDGIECFGGTVNISNAMVFWQGDDGIDLDQNYSGTIDNWVVSHGDGVGTDEGLEIDGPEGTANDGLFTLSNGTVKSDGIAGSAADLKSKAQGTLNNVKFEGYAGGATLKIRASYQNNCSEAKEDAFTHLTDANATLVITSSEFGNVNVYTSSTDANDSDCAVSDADQTAAATAATSTSATGADMSVFSWTAASMSGDL